MLETARKIGIHLFGRPHLTDDEVPLKFKAPARALSLLAYLLVHRKAPLTRDAVAFALWPDEVEADARANLRRHLFYLTNDVLPPAPPKTPWIVADKRTISWNAAASAWCDVLEFERLGADPSSAAAAVTLYHGELLKGFEDEWLQAPRERLHERQVHLLLSLIDSSRAAGALAAGIGYARQLLAIDPWREDGVRALIELRNAAGDRAGALATYRDFVKRLAAEMGVEPMLETTAVYERVSAANLPPTPAAESSLAASFASENGAPEKTAPAEPAFGPSPYWRAPESISNADAIRPVPSFTGRGTELALLDAALWKHTGQAAIHGLSGVGKSALAREYARRNRDRYAAVWWLNAETEAGIIDGLVRLGSEFVPGLAKLEDRRSAAEQVTANVLSGLTRPVLLVFDNLDDERFLRTWSPGAAAHILATSRHAILGGDIVPIRLQTLPPQETVDYLRREIGRTDLSDADAIVLAQTLGFLPLALAHAAAYLKATVNVTARRYVERINDHLARTPRGADYDRAVYATFREAIARAEEAAPGAAALLCLAACFAPDAVPEELFHQDARVYASLTPVISEAREPALDLHSALGDAIGTEDALGALHRFSLLTFAPDVRTYTLHRLVQKATRVLLTDGADAWANTAAAVAEAAFPETDFAAWPLCERLVPHARAALDLLPAAACLPAGARLALRCGQYARKRAAFADAEVLLRRGLAIAEACTAAGPYPQIAEHLEALASLLRDTNRLAEAEPLHRRSVELCETNLGPNHPSVAAAVNDLAILLHYSNRLAEAEALYRRALAIDEAAHGADHPLVALRLHNLALVLHETNRLTEAKPLLERALCIDERVAGPHHPDVASDLGNFGWLILETGDIEAAEPLLRRTLQIREAAYGAHHPSFAHALSDVAVLLHDADRFAEAEALYLQALAIYESSYGPHHPVVAACLNNVAELLADDGRFDDAEALYTRALASDEATYGPDHTNVARDLNNLAGLLAARGRLCEAAQLLERALTIVTASYELDHPRVQTVRANTVRLRALSASTSKTQTQIVAGWRNIRRSPSRGLR
jgi:DNA-binding SARP family transcriptional activator/tetratricopeptide (TPR) repeat protein